MQITFHRGAFTSGKGCSHELKLAERRASICSVTEMSQWLVTLTPVPATLPGADKEAWQKQTDAWLEAWNQSLAGMDVAEHRFFEPEELKADLPVGGNHQATAGLPRLGSACCQTRSRIESF